MHQQFLGLFSALPLQNLSGNRFDETTAVIRLARDCRHLENNNFTGGLPDNINGLSYLQEL